MRTTGIVKRIGDLGRVIMPKEIRRTFRLREGTSLETFTDREGEITLKKYSPMVELTTFSGQYAEATVQSTGMIVCITDKDQVIIMSDGSKKDMIQKITGKQLEYTIGEYDMMMASKDDKAFISLISDEMKGIMAQVVAPIICEDNAVGSVALLSRDVKAKFGDMEMKLVLTAATLLGCQMEA